MRLVGIKETIEQAKDFLTEWDGKETGGSDGGVGWRHSIALAVAIIAVVGAIVGLFETEFIADMIRYKNDALLMQNQASDQWSFFQAKTIRSHLYEIIAKVDPRLGPELRESSGRYDRERAEIKQKAENYEKKVKELNEKSSRYYHFHVIFALSVTAFQVSIALLAVSAFTRSKPLWLFAILISIIGLGVIGFGLLLVDLPTARIAGMVGYSLQSVWEPNRNGHNA